MPRAGLNTAEVVNAGADLADEVGIGSVNLVTLAKRLGVKAPALYKHVEDIDDLKHRIATLAMTELGDVLRDALQGKSRGDAIGALFTALQSYITKHPGRYSATTGVKLQDRDDPLFAAATRVIESFRAVLGGYSLQPNELDHAIRTLRCLIHGYALLQAANAFQWENDPDESVAWMIRFVHAGLSVTGNNSNSINQ
jgi:AcrR family transcriptional regulator